ncbi:MAG: GyrI-like domain-containing protein [Oscillospiraceae bacterium]|nr:GyrI-like domain-containing protein [Oscillospiraceae bacterium]
MPIDFKKTRKDLYQPKTTPAVIDVPEMVFIMVDGTGNPNVSEEYKSALEILYGLSYTIKMSNKSVMEYVVPPLEGLWWLNDSSEEWYKDKGKYCWTAMIRQPDFITTDIFEAAKAKLDTKKPQLDISKARLEKFTEGLCVQAMHIGSYDDEPRTNAVIMQFIAENNYVSDISDNRQPGSGRRHHEIYLNDPRKTAPEKLKTIIRVPVKNQ